jgi:hypothetical protein
MLLRNPKRDIRFKSALALCIDRTSLRVDQILRLVSRERNFTVLGGPIKQLAGADRKQTISKLRRQQQVATGNDRDALFLLYEVAELLPSANDQGIVEFSQLHPALKTRFTFALEHASQLGNPVALQQLVAAEVDSICSGGPQVIRLGEYSESRLGDLLLRGNDDDRAFAMEQLERLHQGDFTSHDSCYPQLLEARVLAKSASLKRRIADAIRQIEQANPSATLPVLVRDMTLAIQSADDPLQLFRTTLQSRNLSARDTCLLALGISENLDETGQREAKTEVLGIAAQYTEKDPKLMAWVGLALGDTVNAARALFHYGLSLRSTVTFVDIERHHAVEAACRLLFRTNATTAAKEYLIQAERYDEAGVKWLGDRIRAWHRALDDFSNYLEARLESAKSRFNPDEIRISQRTIAELTFLSGVNGNFTRYLDRGIS